jgi:hypothetical protein
LDKTQKLFAAWGPSPLERRVGRSLGLSTRRFPDASIGKFHTKYILFILLAFHINFHKDISGNPRKKQKGTYGTQAIR